MNMPAELIRGKISHSKMRIWGIIENLGWRGGGQAKITLPRLMQKLGWQGTIHSLRKLLKEIIDTSEGNFFGHEYELVRTVSCPANHRPDMLRVRRLKNRYQSSTRVFFSEHLEKGEEYWTPHHKTVESLQGIFHGIDPMMNSNFMKFVEYNIRKQQGLKNPDRAFTGFIETLLLNNQDDLPEKLATYLDKARKWWDTLSHSQKDQMAQEARKRHSELLFSKKNQTIKQKKRNLFVLIAIAYAYRDILKTRQPGPVQHRDSMRIMLDELILLPTSILRVQKRKQVKEGDVQAFANARDGPG